LIGVVVEIESAGSFGAGAGAPWTPTVYPKAHSARTDTPHAIFDRQAPSIPVFVRMDFRLPLKDL
jgi:hypothetical protein